MDETKEILKNQFDQLPENLKKVIEESDWQKKLADISSSHNLLIDKAASLENETLFVMIGLEPAKDYITNLKNGLEIDQQTAESIAVDVNREIFDTIKDHLVNFENEIETEEKIPEKDALLEEIEGHMADGSSSANTTQSTEISTLAPRSVIASAYTSKFNQVQKSLTEQKLNDQVRLPKQEIQVGGAITPQTSEENSNMATKDSSYSADPYREPIA